jgi:hypothetical protein
MNDLKLLLEEKKFEVDILQELYDDIIELEAELAEIHEFKRNKEIIYKEKLLIKYYYLRDKLNHPRVTVCLLYDPKTGIGCRGTAVCSYKEATNKEYGRDLAENRALNAWYLELTSGRIKTETSKNIIDDIKTEYSKDEQLPDFIYKQEYNVIFLDFEKKILKIK